MECMEHRKTGMETRKQASESKAQNNSKIINSLNADCWHHILDYLPVKDLLRSEVTCKEWQKLVLNDISRRPIAIYGWETDKNTLVLKQNAQAWSSFNLWLKKCGHAIEHFDMDCQHFRDVVEIFREFCSNLNFLRLRRLKKKPSPTSTLHFQKLKCLVFEYCDDVTDDCVSQFLNTDIAEVTIIHSKRVTGRFLNNLKSDNLKCLHISHCRAFKFSYLLSARLSNVKVLMFWKQTYKKVEIREKLNLLMEKMPNLLEIGFDVYHTNTELYRNLLADSNGFFESVCRLKKLQILNAKFQVWDHHLEALASNCKELAVVKLICHYVTRRGLDALCRLGSLYEVNLSGSEITDDDIVALINGCPNLLYLNISDCHLLETPLQRIALARRDMRDMPSNQRFDRLSVPLQITMSKWDDYGAVDECEEMIEVLDNVIYI